MKEICFFSAVAIVLLGSASPSPSLADANAPAAMPADTSPKLAYANLAAMEFGPEVIHRVPLSAIAPAPSAPAAPDPDGPTCDTEPRASRMGRTRAIAGSLPPAITSRLADVAVATRALDGDRTRAAQILTRQ